MSPRAKKIGIGVVVFLILIQLYRPARNLSNDQTHHISTVYHVPDTVKAILKVSCDDCHSNLTVYPWYANVQPVSGWLTHHINEGREELNLSEFTTYSPRRQNHKMDEIIKMMDEHEMPLASYTIIHKDAVMTDAQRLALSSWAQGVMDTMKATYPADSLRMPQRKSRN